MWFVYKIVRDGEIVYIGKGAGYRHRASAKKHDGVSEIVVHFPKEQEAFEFEKLLIAEIRPACNRSAGGDGGQCHAETQRRKLEVERRARRNFSRSKYETYRKADQHDPFALLCAFSFARSDKDWNRFNHYVGLAKTVGPWKPDPIWDGVYETFQKIQPIQVIDL